MLYPPGMKFYVNQLTSRKAKRTNVRAMRDNEKKNGNHQNGALTKRLAHRSLVSKRIYKLPRSKKPVAYKPKPKKTSSGLCFAALNIDGQRNKIPQLAAVMTKKYIVPGVQTPDVLAISESHETSADDYKLPHHFWIGKPGPQSGNFGYAGVGFWINNKHKLACTIAPGFITPHKDIL
jgi:hypothetical protein